MKVLKILAVASLAVVLLLPGQAFGSPAQQRGDRKVVFEEIGQFNDGGMAVTVLVAGNLAYVCEFDNGLEIIRFRKEAAETAK